MKRGWVLVLTMVGLSCALHAQQAGNDSVRSVATDMRVFDVRVTDMVAPTADTAAIVADTRHETDHAPQAVWLPDPQKSLWYAFIFPGAGQIYNRSYWKLPIVYGGAVGLVYGISWNNRY